MLRLDAMARRKVCPFGLAEWRQWQLLGMYTALCRRHLRWRCHCSSNEDSFSGLHAQKVPAVDYSQPSKADWSPSECLQLRVFGQPPVGDDITETETGGGSAPGHEQRMSTFCRVASFPHLG